MWPGLAGGVALAAVGFWSAGRRVQRSRYRPDHWRAAEIVVAASGLVVAAGGVLGVHGQPTVLGPALDAAPEVSLTSLVVVLLGAVAALAAPAPPLAQETGPVRQEVGDARAA